ncbi:outer membrane beta-barrel protein [Sphingobacterium sp. SG20118]|uniref:outer membrane beta-barrel protein n=1 Tax=Sphingobacterium sp. SG20118 TaxID=3367156 RepID=UPI0037DFBEB1
MKQFIITIIIILITATQMVAQLSTGISGSVVDKKGDFVEGATVSLYAAKDSSIVEIKMTKKNGGFKFAPISLGSYTVIISYIGESRYKSEVLVLDASNNGILLSPITIEQNPVALKEVLIIKQKSFIEQKIDRTVVNVNALISNSGSSALDVLEKAPGVRVDQNGSITLKGRSGVAIFIDDRPTFLSGADLESYLKSLPSSSLDQIQIMTNPPAKYDAAGNAGIINITTKKQNIRGFNMGINSSIGQHKYTTTNHGLDFNYKNRKLNVYGNLGYMLRNGFTNLVINRTHKDDGGAISSFFNQNSNIRKTGHGFNAIVGLDYYASEKTTWGINVGGNLRYPTSNINSKSLISDAGGKLDSTVLARNTEKSKYTNESININFRHLFTKSKSDLAVDLDYITYQIGNDQSFMNDGHLENGSNGSHELLNGVLLSHINIYAAKTDYTLPLKGNIKIASGLKTSITETDNIADYFFTLKNQSVPDYDKTNRFKYNENINAAYLNLNKDYKNLSIQMGLRVENTLSKGHQFGNITKQDSSFKRNYTGLFPTLFMLYKLDSLEINQLRLNFGRRIDRPYFQDLNPFISPLDKFTYLVGNPNLKPAYSHKVELSYIYLKRITGTVAYSSTKNQTNETIEIVDEIYYSRPDNIGSTKVLSFSLDGSFSPTTWLNFQLYSEVAHVHAKSSFYTGMLDNKGINGYLQGMIGFKPGRDWLIQFDGNYQSKITNAQFVYGSKWGINMGVSKKISQNASVKFNMNDLFYTNINKGIINNLKSTDANYKNIGDTRRALLTLSYRFGKTIASPEKYDSKGADDEKNRVKQ